MTESADHAQEAAWIIQRCTQRWRTVTELEYEDWPGYSEHLMTRAEMLEALEECEREWPDEEFRGHNVVNARKPRERIIS